jgi:hypothetical protein
LCCTSLHIQQYTNKKDIQIDVDSNNKHNKNTYKNEKKNNVEQTVESSGSVGKAKGDVASVINDGVDTVTHGLVKAEVCCSSSDA